MPKKSDRKKLKQKAWKLFSQYIRMRDADKNGMVKCVTCGKREHWKDVDAGHFVSRAYLSTFFEETNVHPQCRFENRFRNGAPDEYAAFIIKKYGMKELERLRLLKHQTAKFNEGWYEQFIKELKEFVAEQKERLGD